MRLMPIRRRLARYRLLLSLAKWLRQKRAQLEDNLRYRSTRKRLAFDAPVCKTHVDAPNVVLLVVDSLRNDALSCNGYFRETTPFLDTFDCKLPAISASHWTYPSVASIITGLYPHNHGAFLSGETKDLRRPETYLRIREHVATLPEILRFFGYRIFYATGIPLSNRYKFRTGAPPRQYPPTTAAGEMLADLERWIEHSRSRKFFAYVQLADLHPPMRLPESHRHWFGDVRDQREIHAYDFMTEAERQADPVAFEHYRQERRLLYDNALRYVDSAFEAFHQGLIRMGLSDSTLLIVTSDHGEQFWEHADFGPQRFQLAWEVSGIGHIEAPYAETIQVPLLFKGSVPPHPVKGLVSTTDIVPTVLDLVGISHKWRFDGQNAFTPTGHRVLLSEASSNGHEKKSLTIGRYRLLYSKDDGIEWLFDLERDPEEQHPIMDEAVTSILVNRLLSMLERDEKRKAFQTVRKTTAKMGYTGRGTA